jgi:hypothetical protein
LPAAVVFAALLGVGIGCGRHEGTGPGGGRPAAAESVPTPSAEALAAALAAPAAGHIDVLAAVVGGRAGQAIKRGEMAKAVGWSLTHGRGPALVILTIDGKKVGETMRLSARPDVNDYFGRNVGACAWRIDFSTADLAPGDHQVNLFASEAVGDPGVAIPGTWKLSVAE